MGSLAAGGAATIGTGAFTSIQANRSVTLNVADDADAFLGLEPQPAANGPGDTPNAQDYVFTETDGTIEIDISTTSNGGQGLNKDSAAQFRNLIQVENQGTQGIIFGHSMSFAPQTAYVYHDDGRYKPGGAKKQAGETNLVNDGNPDNAGTNVNNISTKNLPYIKAGDTLKNIGIGVTEPESFADLNSPTVTFHAATNPSDL